jgi:hypothetical protein
MADDIQDEDLVKADLRRQEKLEGERSILEGIYRDAEILCDPMAAGAFSGNNQTPRRNYNFDSTAIEGLDRFDAALGAVTMPKTERWLGLTVYDKDLARDPEVQRWLEHAADRLWDCIYAPHAAFGTAASEDRRALGCYGTSALWVDDSKGKGLFFRALHMSEEYIDVDFRGQVDTNHRKFEITARQGEQMFGADNLSPKMADALKDPNKCDDHKFRVLHVVRPNEQYSPGKLDHRGKGIASRYIDIEAKFTLRRGGYFTNPIPVSRNATSPGQKYGTSPMFKVIGTQQTLNEMAKTILRAAHKAVDPPILFMRRRGHFQARDEAWRTQSRAWSTSEGQLLAQPMPDRWQPRPRPGHAGG